ncbi:MAG: hypothetical protein U0703_05010 [Anaerolineae bacterium]
MGYIGIALAILISLDRGFFCCSPLWSTLAFPPFILSPFVIMASPLFRAPSKPAILLLILIVMLLGVYDGGYLELAIQVRFSPGWRSADIVVGFARLLTWGISPFSRSAYAWGMFTSTNTATFFVIQRADRPAWAFFIFIPIAVLVAGFVGILLGFAGAATAR